jgi:beta-N-acetylhexosaminidase
LARVVIRTKRAELERRLLPFRRGILAGARLVMVSNASYPALDASGRPALFSHAIVTDLLRKRLGFTGVVITDGMEAPTPAAFPGAPAAAIEAGVDVLLYTSEAGSRRGFEQLLAAARAKRALRSDLQAAYARIAALRRRLGG